MPSLYEQLNTQALNTIAHASDPWIDHLNYQRDLREKHATENKRFNNALALALEQGKIDRKRALELAKINNESSDKRERMRIGAQIAASGASRLAAESKAEKVYKEALIRETRKKYPQVKINSKLGLDDQISSLDEQVAEIESKKEKEAADKGENAVRGAELTIEDFNKQLGTYDTQIEQARSTDEAYLSKLSNQMAQKKFMDLSSGLTEDEMKSINQVLGGSGGRLTYEGAINAASGITPARKQELRAKLSELREQAYSESASTKRPTQEVISDLVRRRANVEKEFIDFKSEPRYREARDKALIRRAIVPTTAPTVSAEDPNQAPRSKAAMLLGDIAGTAPAAVGFGNLRRAEDGMPTPEVESEPVMDPQYPDEYPDSIPVDPVDTRVSRRTPQQEEYLRRLASPQPTAPVPESISRAEAARRARSGIIATPPVIQSPTPAVQVPVFQQPPQLLAPGTSVFTPNPASDEKAIAIWGPDAPALLREAARLATQNGIGPEQQSGSFISAISGDADAQASIGRVLNYIRQQKLNPVNVQP